MKSEIIKKYLLALAFLLTANLLMAQDEETAPAGEKPRPARPAFDAPLLIDNQTDVVNLKNTLEWNIQHRFGTAENGIKDLYGIFAPSNIRLGFSYTLLDRMALGFGLTKINVTNPFVDLNLKYKILQQGREGGMPINLTYFGNLAIDTRNEENFDKGVHRLSYFHQLIISRRFSSKFSAQLSPTFSHFNAVDTLYSNDVLGLNIALRYKVSPQGSIILEWTEPLTKHDVNEADDQFRKDAGPERNVSIGYEIRTSSHDFQFFFGTYKNLLPQYNLTYNTNTWIKEVEGENKIAFLIGFNMTRLWNF
jgi:hypothetical protein